jgi:hypothetical protein
LESSEFAALDVPWLSPIVHVKDRSSQKDPVFFDQIVIPRLNSVSILFSSFSTLSESGDLSSFCLPSHHGGYQDVAFCPSGRELLA